MRKLVGPLALVIGTGLALSPTTAAYASTFTSATAHTSGDELEIDFVERGLQPGQNYDYIGTSTSATETFQCYHPRTFTPTHRTIAVTTTTFSSDVRTYQANARGVVRGFVFVIPILSPFHGCGHHLDTVPIFISYTDFSLTNGVTFDEVDKSGTISGAIEPD